MCTEMDYTVGCKSSLDEYRKTEMIDQFEKQNYTS